MPIILSGGGDARDVLPLDRYFAEIVDRERPVLYVPVAMEADDGYASCLAWFTDTYAPFGITRIEMGTDLSALTLADRYSAVYIGGGNTFRLLDTVRRTGFDAQLRAYLAAGGILYGGSAGAILCGKTIAPAYHGDENTIGLTDLSGLDLLGGYDVWCHYDEPADDAAINRYPGALYVLYEASGLVVHAEGISALGKPFRVKNAGGMR